MPRDPLNKCYARRFRDSELGMTMLGLVLIVFSIVVLVALAFDLASLFHAAAEQHALARNVATAVLREYTKTPGPLDVRLTAVKNKATEILHGNVRFTQAMQIDPSAGNQVEPIGGSYSGGTDGDLRAGIWHFAPPSDCTVYPASQTCPCNSSHAWKEPCFEAVDLDSNPSAPINAFHVELRNSGSSSIRTLFMGVVQVFSSSFSTEATAITYPRHVVFLLDLSRSAHADTHQAYESASASPATFNLASEYAFNLSGTCADYATCPPGPLAAATVLTPACDIKGGLVPTLYRQIWYGLGSYKPIPADIPSPRSSSIRQHYKAEYNCFELTWTDPLIRPAPYNQTYLVDMRRDPTIPYYGPEPLSSMLTGVNSALNITAQPDHVAGDRIGFIAYDYSASVTERTMNLLPPEDAVYQNLMNMTDPADPICATDPTKTAGDCAVQNRILITRKESGSNLPEALKRAREMLRNAPPEEAAEEHVVVISSGLSNCSGNRVCPNSQAGIEASISEVENIIYSTYVPENIHLHFLQTGAVSGPHTLLVPSGVKTNPDGTARDCMSAAEARGHTPPLKFTDVTSGTDSTDFDNAVTNSGGTLQGTDKLTQARRYFLPNRLYDAVSATSGLWAPIRSPCSEGVDITPQLIDACRGKTLAPSGENPNTINLPPYTDNYGRLLCDPKGLKPRAQIENAIRTILGRGSSFVVE